MNHAKRLACLVFATALAAAACHPFESVDDYRVIDTSEANGDGTIDPGDLPDITSPGDTTEPDATSPSDGTLIDVEPDVDTIDPECPDPLDFLCDGECIDVAGNVVESCDGTCTDLCGRAGTCSEGGCACPDLPNIVTCPAPENGVQIHCIDLDNDRRNCGECGNACGRNAACVGGICECAAGATSCLGMGCVDLTTSTANCGECGLTCEGTKVCVDGECVTAIEDCEDGQLDCDTAIEGCETEAGTNRNCGACGVRCADDEYCNETVCSPCEGGQLTCRDENGEEQACGTPVSEDDCGGCGVTCTVGAECSLDRGRCECSNDLEAFCGPEIGCVDLTSDPAHCGACDTPCMTGQTCIAERCEGSPACPADCGPLAFCNATTAGQCECYFDCNGDGFCDDVDSDPRWCGSCNTACPDGQNCDAGTCKACSDPNTLECVPDDGMGCETMFDVFNCGGCNVECTATTPYCVDGFCVECTSNTDCPDGSPCDNGTCGPAMGCVPGGCGNGLCCGGACSNQTPTNCGFCNNVCALGDVCDAQLGCVECIVDSNCAAGETCVGSQCMGSMTMCVETANCQSDEQCCGGVCQPNQPTACGSCTLVCPPGQGCVDGVCGGCSNDGHCGPNAVCAGGTCI